MTKHLLILIFLAVMSLNGKAQINLVGAATNQGTGMIDILKWEALDSSSVTTYPSILQGYYLASSAYDSYSSNYYLTGISGTSVGLYSFNTITNTENLASFTSFSNITEIDMSTGKIYSLQMDSSEYISVNEFDIKDGTDSLLGVIYEPGAIGIIVDAIGFNSNYGILYYVGFTSGPSLCLYGIHVREEEFNFTRTTLVTTAPGNNITSVNYDNVNDILYAMDATFDAEGNYTGNEVVEINKTTGEVIVRGELVEFPYFLAGSSSFDQNSGSLLLVGFDTNFVERMIVFNTYDNTYQTGFVPDFVSEIVCDNSVFATNTYITTSVPEKDKTTFNVFPNPATSSIKISKNGVWSEDILVSIYNMIGGLVLQQSFQPDETVELDLSTLKTGTYLLKLVSGEVIETRKIMIR